MIRISETDARAVWAQKIGDQWRKSVDDIIEVGRLLAQAKQELEAAAFKAMVENDLPFSDRAARMLIGVGTNDWIRNHGSDLPASWRTLYELTRLPAKALEYGLRQKIITPEMERKEIDLLKERVDDAVRPKPPKVEPRDAESTETAESPVRSILQSPPSTTEVAAPRRDALDGAEQALGDAIRSLDNLDMNAVAAANNTQAIAKIRGHIERLRTRLAAIERAVAPRAA